MNLRAAEGRVEPRIGRHMGKRPTGDRNKDLLQLLRSEFRHNLEGWLEAHGVRTNSAAVRNALLPYLRGPLARDGEPDPVRRGAWTSVVRLSPAQEDDWLLRHLLDPASPNCLLPPDGAKAVRARLLAKLRDQARIVRCPVVTVRVPDETALLLDMIGRRLFGSTSRSETVKAMARVATANSRVLDTENG